ncbi:MAG: histidine--tRNA ligase [bacterium]|nr:histidine--tRNA ligase [bacterium]
MAKEKIQKTNKKVAKKTRRVEPTLPGGFRDYGPSDAIARSQMIEIIRKTFENFGFDPMETASIQRKNVLFGGEKESEKIVFDVKGSREKKSDTALRFDLTVPFARFMAANPEIPKPFKRYQIGTVWRGESPQAGRYREFMQADIDIIGSSSVNADAEVIAMIYQTLKNLGIDDFVIKVNNRKLLTVLPKLCKFSESKLGIVLGLIDKIDKIGEKQIFDILKKEIGAVSVASLRELMSAIGTGRDISQISLNGKMITSLAEEGTRELWQINAALELFGLKRGKYWQFNPLTVRGLSYYTGMIFETFLTKAPEMGSIFSGGRYDELLIPFTGQKIPAVGASVGIDRLFAALEKLNVVKKQVTLTRVLVLNLSSELKSEYLAMVKQLREAKINTSFYLGDDTSFQAQFSYAVKKEIPFVVILGEEEKKKGVIAIKNLKTREQKEIKRKDFVAFFKK